MSRTTEAELADILTAVVEAERAVTAGELIELAGLDEALTRVCTAAPTLPAAERRVVADQLAALADALDRLARGIAHQREAAGRRRAADAYGGSL
jgi:hypothetical protein